MQNKKLKIPKHRRIKVMHVIFGLRHGGAERMLFNVLKYTNAERFDTSVVCVVEGGPFQERIESLGIPVTIIGKKRKLGISTFWKLYKHMRALQPDICHTHLFAGDFWGRIAAFFAHVPVVISTEHNTNVDEGKIKSCIRRILSWKTDKIVAISHAIKEYSVQVDKIKEEKVEVIYSGIDVQELQKHCHFSEFHFNAQQPLITIVGRLEEQKGHRYFIDALPALVQKYPQLQVQFVGDGSLKGTLLQQAKELGVDSSIQFLGSRSDVFSLMQKADIVCMPSLFEGLGLVAQEALYLQKPLIASRVGGLQEIIKDKETGILVNPKSSQEIAQAIISLLQQPDIAYQLAKKGHEDVASRFDVSFLTKQYESLYEELLHAKFLQSQKIEDAVIALTYLCNSRCIMCNIWQIKDKPTVTIEDYKKLPSTLKYINISGGEPFLRPDIVDIVKSIKTQLPKAQLVISSNGFSTDLIIKKVKEILAVDPTIGIALSLDGMQEMHEKVRRIPDGYNKVLNTLHALQALGVKYLRLAFTAADYNIHELNEVYQLARQEKVDFTMAAVHNSVNYFAIENNKIDLKDKFISEFTHYITCELKRLNPKKWLRAYFAWGLLQHVLHGGRVLPDYSGKKHIFIDPDGNVFPCDVSVNKMGNIKDAASFHALLKEKDAFEAVQFNRRHNDHWMICTVRMSMRSHPFRVLAWIIKSKLMGVRV